MAELLPGEHVREQQFFTVRGKRRNGLCSQNGIASAETLQGGAYVWTGTIFERMQDAHQLMNDDGASDIVQQNARLQDDGFKTIVHNYAGDDWTNAVPWVQSMVEQGLAVVAMVAHGSALLDSITGKPNWIGKVPLRYHTFSFHGWHVGGFSQVAQRILPPGGWTADGDAQAQGNVLQFYTADVLAAAHICAAIAVYPKGHTTVSVYPGWSYDPATMTITSPVAPDGVAHTASEGFGQHIYDAQTNGSWPKNRIILNQGDDIGDKSAGTFETRQMCSDIELRWKTGTQVWEQELGGDVLALRKTNADLVAQIVQLTAELKSGGKGNEAISAFLGNPQIAGLLGAFKALGSGDTFTLN